MGSKSWSTVVQEDKSVATTAEAQTIIGAEAQQIAPVGTSIIAAAPDTTFGDITVTQFPEPVQRTIQSLIGMTETAIGTGARAQLASTEALGEKLQSLQVGEAAMLPKIILYIVVGGGALLVLARMFKR